MKFEYYGWDDGTSLYHYGIHGMKWGVRRWQNPDGTFTPEGKERYFGSKSSKITHDQKTYTYDKLYGSGKATITRDSYTSTDPGNAEARKKFDSFAENEDYAEADERFDYAADKAIKAYEKNGNIKEAMAILKKELNGVRYEFKITDEQSDDVPEGYDKERYLGYTLTVYGNKYGYRTFGEPDYSDEQYFFDINDD